MSIESKSLAILGTASSVGKSLVTTGLCRVIHQDGLRVAPFKASNVSLNSGVTEEGGEMARSQIVQAEAAGIEPHVDMNPILLKETEHASQYIVLGKSVDPQKVGDVYKNRWSIITGSIDKLRSLYQVVLVEGSGSPSELNLMNRDIANLAVVKYVEAPVVLVANIDAQGAFASLVGTLEIIKKYDPDAAKFIKAFVINNYRGERTYLEDGIKKLTDMTQVPVIGVIPRVENHGVAREDSYQMEAQNIKQKNEILDIVIIQTPTLQNTDDMDPLIGTPGVRVRFVSEVRSFGEPDLVILGGAKATVADLAWMREKGFAGLIQKHAKNKKTLIGICGGFQMLGEVIVDQDGVESPQREVKGLELLPVRTLFEWKYEKITEKVSGIIGKSNGLLEAASGMQIDGYEIHMARTERVDGLPMESVTVSEDSPIMGTYFHGIFHNEMLKKVVLEYVAREKRVTLPEDHWISAESRYNILADVMRTNIDMDYLYTIMGLKNSSLL
jgi:adenosylcobyric acid synthase